MMFGASRVAWREGLFLRPQHFQQQDRHFDVLLRARTAGMAPYPWGLGELTISESQAQLGKFGIDRCAGALPDGLPFFFPGDAPPPPPLDIPPDTRDAIVYLTLPVQQTAAAEFQARKEADPAVRYVVDEVDAFDAFADERLTERIEVARPQLRFGLTRDQTEGRVTVGLARIREVLNGRVQFDDRYIPPVLDIRASPKLTGYVADIIGRGGQRVDELALRAVDVTDGGSESFAKFLMLQCLNRWLPILEHVRSLPNVHPERLYETFVSMAGELSTLTRDDRKPPRFPLYDHENLQQTFEPVFEAIQVSLSIAFENSAGQLRLEPWGPGAYRAKINDGSIFETCSLYLAVSARTPEDLRARFPSVVKISTVGKIQEIVNNALQAGIRITPTPTPPAQLRVLPGFVYFELDRAAPDWRELASAPGLGLVVAGDWPDLKLELWWVKRVKR